MGLHSPASTRKTPPVAPIVNLAISYSQQPSAACPLLQLSATSCHCGMRDSPLSNPGVLQSLRLIAPTPYPAAVQGSTNRAPPPASKRPRVLPLSGSTADSTLAPRKLPGAPFPTGCAPHLHLRVQDNTQVHDTGAADLRYTASQLHRLSRALILVRYRCATAPENAFSLQDVLLVLCGVPARVPTTTSPWIGLVD